MTANTIYLQRQFIKTPSFTAQEVVDELILVRIQSETQSFEEIYSLNPVGARIWQLIDGSRKVEEIRDTIVADFEISPEQAEADLIEFLKQLEETGAVQPA